MAVKLLLNTVSSVPLKVWLLNTGATFSEYSLQQESQYKTALDDEACLYAYLNLYDSPYLIEEVWKPLSPAAPKVGQLTLCDTAVEPNV